MWLLHTYKELKLCRNEAAIKIKYLTFLSIPVRNNSDTPKIGKKFMDPYVNTYYLISHKLQFNRFDRLHETFQHKLEAFYCIETLYCKLVCELGFLHYSLITSYHLCKLWYSRNVCNRRQFLEQGESLILVNKGKMNKACTPVPDFSWELNNTRCRHHHIFHSSFVAEFLDLE